MGNITVPHIYIYNKYHTYIHICVSIQVCTHRHIKDMCICKYIYIYVCRSDIRTYIYMYVCEYILMSIHFIGFNIIRHTHIYLYIYTTVYIYLSP